MPSSRLPLETLAADSTLAQGEIARRLRGGALALILGAGASHGMGLPTWWQLVRDCAAAAGVNETVNEDSPTETLSRVMSAVERTVKDVGKYHEIVRSCLYATCKGDEVLLEQRLLAVLGALTMKSRRGSIAEVLTFNFDDVLERYLRLHGFESQVIVELPTLREESDITIYHPHGFLPSPDSLMTDSKEIILSKYSFDRRLGDRVNLWTEVSRDLLMRKVVLVVGLSYNTSTLSAALADLGGKIRESRGPTGFWLVGPKDPPDTEAELLQLNIVPIRIKEYSQYSEFLLKVCQRAQRSDF